MRLSWYSFWVTETPFTYMETGQKFQRLPWNVSDTYRDSHDNLLGILAVVIMLSPISSVCGGDREQGHDSFICM